MSRLARKRSASASQWPGSRTGSSVARPAGRLATRSAARGCCELRRTRPASRKARVVGTSTRPRRENGSSNPPSSAVTCSGVRAPERSSIITTAFIQVDGSETARNRFRPIAADGDRRASTKMLVSRVYFGTVSLGRTDRDRLRQPGGRCRRAPPRGRRPDPGRRRRCPSRWRRPGWRAPAPVSSGP